MPLLPTTRRKKIPLGEATQEVRIKKKSSLASSAAHTRKKARKAMSTLIEPHENDVLMGRGGKNNQHSGNEKLRTMARKVCDKYKLSTKKGKSIISRDLVRQVRELTPPGRFLKRDQETGKWDDVGDDVAREKASQVLRDALGLHIGIPTSTLSNNVDSGSKKRKTPEPSKTTSTTTGFITSPLEKRGRQGITSPLLQMRRGSPEHVQSGAIMAPQSWGGGGRASFGGGGGGGGPISSQIMGFPPPGFAALPAAPPSAAAAAAAAPPYLPVTPSFSVSKRKRHRAYETPDAFANVYNPFVPMNTSPSSGSGYTPPMPPPGPPPPQPQPPGGYNYPTQRPYVSFPSQYPPSNAATTAGRVTDSFNRAGGRSSSSLYQYPASAGRNSLSLGFLDDVPPPPPPHDFDLFNGELLSDQSDRDGAVSPAVYYQYSRHNHDRRESL